MAERLMRDRPQRALWLVVLPPSPSASLTARMPITA